MAPTKSSVREILNSDSKNFIFVEPYVDTNMFLPDGFLGKIIAAAELSTFISCRPEGIFPVPVIEFFGTFDSATLSSRRISTRLPVEGGEVELGSSSVSWMDLATTKLELRDDGLDVESAGCSDPTAELRRFSEDPKEVFVVSKTATKCLKPIFKTLCDLVSKVILSHVGSISTVTRSKLTVMAALVDELKGIKYNWARFIIGQWMEVAKDVKATNDPHAFEMGNRLRYGSKLSFAIASMCPTLDRRFSAAAKANPLFSHQVDMPITSVVVPDAILTGEKRKETASPSEPIPKGKRTRRSKRQDSSSVAKSARRRVILDEVEEEEVDEDVADTSVESEANPSASTATNEEEAQPNQEPLDTIFEDLEADSGDAEVGEGGEAGGNEGAEERQSFDSGVQDAILAFKFAPEAESNALDGAKQQAHLERIEASGEVSRHFSGVELTEEQLGLLTEFLVYTRVRGTEYYKLFEMIDAEGREELKRKELSLLATFKASGFGDFLDLSAVWRKMEEFIAQTVPDLYSILPNRQTNEEAGPSGSDELTKLQSDVEKLIADNSELANLAKEAEKAHQELEEAVLKKEAELKVLRSNLTKELEFGAQLEKEKAQAIEEKSLAIARLETQAKRDEEIRAELQAAYNDKITQADERFNNLNCKFTELEQALTEAKRVIKALEASASSTASEAAEMTIRLVSLDLEKAEADDIAKKSEEEKAELLSEVARLKEELATKDAAIAEARVPSAEVETLKALLNAKEEAMAKVLADSKAFVAKKHAEYTEAIPHVLKMEPYLKSFISKKIDLAINSTCGNILAHFAKGAEAAAPKAPTQTTPSGALALTRAAGMTPSGVIAKGEMKASLVKKTSLVEKKASTAVASEVSIPQLIRPLRQVPPLKGVIIGEPQAAKAMGGAMGGEASSGVGPSGTAGKGKEKVIYPSDPPATKTKKKIASKVQVPPSEAAEDEAENLEAIYGTEAAARKESLEVEFELKHHRGYRNLYLKFAPTNLQERKALMVHAKRLAVAEMTVECRGSDQIEAVKVATEKIISKFSPKLTDKQKPTFDKLMKRILDRSQEEIVAKQTELGIKRIEEVLPEENLAEWRKAELMFIKLYYFWGVYKTNSTNAFVGYMEQFHKSLWTIILEKLGDSFVLAPEKRTLEAPGADGIVDRGLIDREVRELLSLLDLQKPTFAELHEAKQRVYEAYGLHPPRL